MRLEKVRFKLLTFVAFLFCMGFSVPIKTIAQTNSSGIPVSGIVLDQNRETVIGANVIVKGTDIGAVTDVNGSYSIQVPNENAILQISYLGYKTQEIRVGNQRKIDVTLMEDSQLLSEVVVVGYGTMKRSDLTGAVTSVRSEAIQQSLPTSIDQVLQGRASGVQVQQNSGMPGASTSVRIRGISSLNAPTDPIYVIDGVVINGGPSNNDIASNPLNSINPADIVSMDILKDASATAIYGSRAANGVIMITTRRGQKGEAIVNYNGYAGWQQIPTKLDLLNLRQYAENRNVLSDHNLATASNYFVRPDLLGEGTDWQKELFSTAFRQNHQISISGGGDASTYSLGAGYSNTDGIATGSGFKRLNLSGNFDAQAKKWLKAGVNFAFSNTFQTLTTSDQDLIQKALRTTPDVAVRNADGSFAGSDDPNAAYMPPNPIAMSLLIDNRNETYGIRANTFAEITPGGAITGLKFRSELSFDYNTSNGYRFVPTWRLSQSQFNNENEGKITKQYNKFWNWANTLTYDRTFGTAHKLTIMLGQEASNSYWSYLMGWRKNYPTNEATDLTLGDGVTPGNSSNDGYTGVLPMAGFFGRFFYSYADRYLLTATVRRDGSSNFAPGHQWGTFPSAALAWRVSEEDFLKDNNTIDNLKLRLGWGKVGNQNIPDHYSYLMRYSVLGSGLYADNMYNENVTWETTTSLNAGFDLSMLKNKIELIFDVYNKKTDNLLMYLYYPDYLTYGRSLAWGNVGSLQNKGIEITLNTLNAQTKDFTWRSNLTFSLNRNKVLNMGTNETNQILGRVDDNSWGVTAQTVINRTTAGQPIGQFYGYQIIGRFEKATDFYCKNDKGEIIRTPVTTLSDGSMLSINENAGVWIGDYIYKDQPTDPVYDAAGNIIGYKPDGVINEKDRIFIGNPEPKFTYGFNNTFAYKNVDMTIMLTGVYGNDVVNYARRFMQNPRRNISNLFTSALDYAKLGLINPDGPNDFRNVQIIGGDPLSPRMPLSTTSSDYNFLFSDRFVEDGSYLRIQNISLGYTFPKRWMRSIGISSVKIYANVQNLYTFTKYKGYDPEIGVSYGYQNSLLTGVDNGRYPSPRIYTFGLNVSF